jgi:hypothetical protein
VKIKKKGIYIPIIGYSCKGVGVDESVSKKSPPHIRGGAAVA